MNITATTLTKRLNANGTEKAKAFIRQIEEFNAGLSCNPWSVIATEAMAFLKGQA